MKTVIFNNNDALFKFSQKEVRDHLRGNLAESAFDEISQMLELISNNRDETIFNLDDNHYFGYVALELMGSGKGIVVCKNCDETYDAGQVKMSAIGYGKSPFDSKQKQKGGFSLVGKRKNRSMFGGQILKCSEGHTLISMETWRT